jgi:hypothetical protein
MFSVSAIQMYKQEETVLNTIICSKQCFGSGSESRSALNPHSMGSWIWIRIHKSEIYPKKEEELSVKTRKNRKISIF